MRKIDVNGIIDNARFNGFHRTVLFWAFLIIIFDVYDLVIYGVVLPVLMDKWNLSAMEAGKLGSYALFGMMFGAIVFGALADRFGRKKIIMACLTLFSVFTFLSTIATNPMQFGIFRFAAGLGIGGLMPNAVAIITEYAPKKIRSLLTTIMFSGYGFGGMISAGLGIALVPNFGWQSVFYVGTIPLLLLPLIYKYLPDSIGFLVREGNKAKITTILSRIDASYVYQDGDEFIMEEKKKGVSLSKLFTEGRAFSTIMFWTAFFVCLLMVYGLGSWLPKLMTKAGYPLGSSLTFLLVMNMGIMIGAIIGGWLGDKFHIKKVIVIYFCLAVVSLSLLGFKSNAFVLYFLIGIAGATTSGTQILLYAYVAQFYPMESRSTGIGWASGVGRIGGILGPILGGVLLSSNLPLQANFAVFAIPGVIGAIAIGLVSLKYAYASSYNIELKK